MTVKKDPSTRQRRNLASTKAFLKIDGGVGVAPPLPPCAEDDGQWSQLTLEWWDELWSSPMSAEYHDSDKHQLFVIAQLMDDFFRATSRTMRMNIAAEIRQQRVSFGLTPYDRRRLEWQIESTEEAQARGVERRNRTAPRPAPTGPDPRSALAS